MSRSRSKDAGSLPLSPHQRFRRRLRAVLLGFALAAIATEIVLQLVALALWATSDGGQRPEGRVVVCLGDSLTFGLGASPAESYPVRLEETLRKQAALWSVVNAGIPGQNSADVVGRLPNLLARYRPDVVCLLVGWNDGWSRPAKVDPNALASDGFPWRWRTGRLFALALAQWNATPEPPPNLPFVGTWHVRGQVVQFSSDGTARLGPLPVTWVLAGADLQITPATGPSFLVRWREWEGGIEFALHGWDRFHRARRGSTDSGVPPEIEEAIEVGELDRALALAGASVGSIATQGRLCLSLLAAGRRAEALGLHERLQEQWRAHQDPVAGEALAQWQLAAGAVEAALVLAERVVGIASDRIGTWRVLVDQGHASGRKALAERIAVAAAKQTSSWRRAELLAEQAVLVSSWDARAAVDLLLAARQVGIGQDESVAALLRMVRLGADAPGLLAAAKASAALPEVRDPFVRDVRRATVSEAEMIEVLTSHLRLVVERCRAAGATPVMVGYPFPTLSREDAARRVATELEVPFVSTFAAFGARMAGMPRAEWFVDEIHCTARGYALLAELVAERVHSLRIR